MGNACEIEHKGGWANSSVALSPNTDDSIAAGRSGVAFHEPSNCIAECAVPEGSMSPGKAPSASVVQSIGRRVKALDESQLLSSQIATPHWSERFAFPMKECGDSSSNSSSGDADEHSSEGKENEFDVDTASSSPLQDTIALQPQKCSHPSGDDSLWPGDDSFWPALPEAWPACDEEEMSRSLHHMPTSHTVAPTRSWAFSSKTLCTGNDANDVSSWCAATTSQNHLLVSLDNEPNLSALGQCTESLEEDPWKDIECAEEIKRVNLALCNSSCVPWAFTDLPKERSEPSSANWTENGWNAGQWSATTPPTYCQTEGQILQGKGKSVICQPAPSLTVNHQLGSAGMSAGGVTQHQVEEPIDSSEILHANLTTHEEDEGAKSPVFRISPIPNRACQWQVRRHA